MSFNEKHEYIRYRLSSAFKIFEAAKILAKTGFWNSAVNRLYYSVFYAVNAILYLNDITCKSHSSVKSQFSLHFVKIGKIDIKYGRLLAELFDWRQKGDFENVFDYDEKSVSPLFDQVEEMLFLIEKEINKQLEID